MKDKQIVNSHYLCIVISFIKSIRFQQVLIQIVTYRYSKLNTCYAC